METNNPILIISFVLSGITLLRYFLYLLISPLYSIQEYQLTKKYKKISKKKIEKNTRVSVIVPAWNEEVGIITSIKSLLRNTYRNLEIIVVNDGSKDRTNETVMKFYERRIKGKNLHGKKFKYINKKRNRGKGSAINSGIKKATGNIIITMDADTKFERDAILNVARYFQNPEIEAAVGNVKLINSKDILGLIQQVEYTLCFYNKRCHSVLNSEYIIGGAFGIFRKKLFSKYGYFDEKSKTEDLDYSMRLKSEGVKIHFIENALAFTEGPVKFLDLCKQRLRWKKGKWDAIIRYQNVLFSITKKHNKILSWLILPLTILADIEIILFPISLYLFISFVINTEPTVLQFAWLVTVTIFLYIGYFFGSKKNGWKGLLIIPFFYIVAYVLVLTEIYAIWGSIRLYIKKADITWQTWNRKGVENV